MDEFLASSGLSVYADKFKDEGYEYWDYFLNDINETKLAEILKETICMKRGQVDRFIAEWKKEKSIMNERGPSPQVIQNGSEIKKVTEGQKPDDAKEMKTEPTGEISQVQVQQQEQKINQTDEKVAPKMDTQDEQMWIERVLDKKINEFPHRKLEVILEEDEANAVFALAIKFKLGNNEVMEIKSKQAGGGSPNKRFVDALRYSGETIQSVIEACEREGMDEIVDELNDIKGQNGKKEKCSDLTPDDACKLYPHLVEDAQSNNIKCWIDLADALGMSGLVANIRSTRTDGYTYSAAAGLFDNLKQRHITVRDFEKKLKELQNPQRVIAEFNTAVKERVRTEKHNDEKEKERCKDKIEKGDNR